MIYEEYISDDITDLLTEVCSECVHKHDCICKNELRTCNKCKKIMNLELDKAEILSEKANLQQFYENRLDTIVYDVMKALNKNWDTGGD